MPLRLPPARPSVAALVALVGLAPASIGARVSSWRPTPSTDRVASFRHPGPSERTSEARLQWWRDARFGLFVHWGPVSLQGTEIGWSRAGERRGYKWGPGKEVPVEVYDNLYKTFNPTRFDADQWVAMAKAAGMKYLVFTSRHHDGFSMFDTAADGYKITSPESPFRKDVVKALADACHRAGLRFGLYYSQPNWHHPDAFTERHSAYLAYLKTQVRELLTNYGKIDILWFDGLGKNAEDYDGAALNRLARELQPDILINDRDGLPEDFDTPEQEVGTFRLDRPWESCITICQQWAWKPEDKLKSLQECLETLIRCAGGDGNLLLNVGPMPDGRVEPRQVERLREVGAWLRQYGESIYGTRGGPWKPTPTAASTRKGNAVYLHILKWDGESLVLPGIARRIVGARLMTGGQVDVKQTDERVAVFVPAASRHSIDTLVRLDLDGPAVALAAK
jgi:alpha-L-fucosidase